MRLGIRTNAESILKETHPWVYAPKGYEYGPDEEKVIFHLRAWTRTAQQIVEKRAKQKNLAIMDADEALKKVGGGDKRAEAYLRELADYLIADWENIVFAEDTTLTIDGEVQSFKAGDQMPCVQQLKVFVFEDVQVAVDVVEAARGLASVQMADEAKNEGRSSAGSLATAS